MLSTNSKSISKTSNILVIDEGFSAEKEVALRSGRNVANNLSLADYKNTETLHLSSREDLKRIIELKLNHKLDLAVLMTHGRFGEDGCIQGFLELLEIPYTGSKVKASANCMNKLTTKALLKANGLDVFANLDLEMLLNTEDEKKDFPIILKATSEGSSVGVEKINNLSEFKNKLNQSPSLKEELKSCSHKKFFIEPYTKGIELTTSILPYDKELYKQLGIDIDSLEADQHLFIDGDLISLPILKLSPKNDFYDYEAKYTAGLTEFELPALVPDDLSIKIHKAALKAYRTMECSGFARVDFIVKETNNIPYILELNTLPGMTDTSDLPAQAKAAKITATQLVEILIHTAI